MPFPRFGFAGVLAVLFYLLFGAQSAASTSPIASLKVAARSVDPERIGKADVVFVPLEDGDRTEGLVRMGEDTLTGSVRTSDPSF